MQKRERSCYLVFAQSPLTELPIADLKRQAERLFDSRIETVPPSLPGTAPSVKLCLTSAAAGLAVAFEVRVQKTEPGDLESARNAEVRGAAFGMARLAERCPVTWRFCPRASDPMPAVYLLCAIFAAVALGPVLPPEHDTLFGVRGALERAKSGGARQ